MVVNSMINKNYKPVTLFSQFNDSWRCMFQGEIIQEVCKNVTSDACLTYHFDLNEA